MDIDVTALDPADGVGAEQAYRISRAASLVDLPDFPEPCRRQFFEVLRRPWPGKRAEQALASLDGVPAGYLSLQLPERDNTDNATVEIFVAPDCRRRGVGRALHGYAVQLLRREGRKRMVGMAVAGLPAGPARSGAGGAFAAAMGAVAALGEVRSRLELGPDDAPRHRALLDGARPYAAGYSPVLWSGAAPPEYVDDVAYLDGRLIEDAPMGDLEWEPERADAAHVRAVEATLARLGMRTYAAGMRHEASGRLVAWTVLAFNESSPWHAWQHITIVDPRHRGHRLGLHVKVLNLLRAREQEPALRAVDTWNAGVNDHMISINRALGFRPVDAWDNWQQAL